MENRVQIRAKSFPTENLGNHLIGSGSVNEAMDRTKKSIVE